MNTVTDQIKKRVFLPYGRQHVTQSDIDEVVSVLKSDWLTQGPKVPEFEREVARTVGAEQAVACSSGTAALHLSMLALGVRSGDIVVTSANTFVASANCASYVGAKVKLADVDPATGLMDINSLRQILQADRDQRIKIVIPVHFAGQPADLAEIHTLAVRHGAYVVDDACHALGAKYEAGGKSYTVGGSPHSDLTVFSFHPVKHVAMGEGGALTTNYESLADRLRLYRNHGLQKEEFAYPEMGMSPLGETNPWYYEMQQPGFNYRLTDMQAALGCSQLQRLPWSVERRQELAAEYRQLLADQFGSVEVSPLEVREGVSHAYHLFVVRFDFEKLGVTRAGVMNGLRKEGIGTQVHYIPVHLQPYYRRINGSGPGDLPGAETYYEKALSLPMYPNLNVEDLQRIVSTLKKVLKRR